MAIPVRALAVIGLGFGDESKGSTVDHLTRLHGAKLVIRFNGGCQAAHNVVEPGGRHHTFAQFGSGALAGAATYLAPGMLVEPFSMISEGTALHIKGVRYPLSNMSVHPDCVITTPYHEIVNRAKEDKLGRKRHGSCGRGIGETRCDELNGIALRMKDLRSTSRSQPILRELKSINRFKLKALNLPDEEFDDLSSEMLAAKYEGFRAEVRIQTFHEVLASLKLAYPDTIIFEGAQGVLLDETYGFAPYNTWTDCTFKNALDLCMGEWGIPLTKIGCLRAYSTRHGAGPFIAESDQVKFPELHNNHSSWQGAWRQGHFDAVMARYAIDCVGGIDQLAISHLDYFNEKDILPWGCIASYEEPYGTNIPPCGLTGAGLYPAKIGTTLWSAAPIQEIERELNMPVKYRSYGPTHNHKACY